MDVKKLNLEDAFRLASILSKYVDEIDKNHPQDALDFISDIVNKLTPEEYLRCVSMMTKLDEETIKKETAIEILTAFIEGMKLNQAFTLISFYKSIGL